MNSIELKVEKKLDAKEADALVNNAQKVTNENIEQSLNYYLLSDE